ncbi:MAG: undecaprenyl-diphosphate phosphatase, partial [Firmicutes bacterium]|nr:undecaprenyl-diphosphate phosphatase [Bacillota bacterium]
RQEAVRFSFLLSIPVILGATILQAREWESVGGALSSALWWGMGASAVSGYVAIHLFTRFMAHRRMTVFGVYTMILGLAILADQLITHRFF